LLIETVVTDQIIFVVEVDHAVECEPILTHFYYSVIQHTKLARFRFLALDTNINGLSNWSKVK
jgi:hypothetical protein